MNQTMTYDHPAFRDFCDRLGKTLGPQGCDHTLNTSIEVLNQFQNIDVASSLEWLESKGGFCDCEVMLNVACGEEELLTPQEIAKRQAEHPLNDFRMERRRAFEAALKRKPHIRFALAFLNTARTVLWAIDSKREVMHKRLIRRHIRIDL